jgi:arabinofuranosyltransferase
MTRSKPLLSLLLPLAVLVALAHAASYGHVTSDDAFISLRYARNLADGHGLVFNPGGERVEGFSNPVLTLLSAGVLELGAAPVATVKTIGMVSWAVLVFVCAHIARCLGRDRQASAVVAAGLLAASTFPALWAVAGLETVLHALLVTVATWVAGRECEAGRVRGAPPLFVLVAASRPEGALLAAAAAATQLVALRSRALDVVRAWTLGFALPVGALVGARYAYFGDVVPNTFGAKVFLGTETLGFGLEYLVGFLRDGGAGVALLAAFGLVAGLRRTSGARPTFVCMGAVVAAQAAFVIVVGGDAMPAYRFVIPVYPLLVVLAAVALEAWFRRFGAGILLAVALAVAGVSMWQQLGGLERSNRRYWLVHERPSWTYLFHGDLAGTWLGAHEAVARYIRTRAEPGDVLVVTEAGLIPFETGLSTVDLLGLNDRRIAQLWQRAARDERESKRAGVPPLREWSYDIAQRAHARHPRWIVLDGHFDAGGTFIPRLGIGAWVMSDVAFAEYHEAFRTRVYDGQATGLGRDRVDVVFERDVTPRSSRE